jgi:hypothetical protein
MWTVLDKNENPISRNGRRVFTTEQAVAIMRATPGTWLFAVPLRWELGAMRTHPLVFVKAKAAA